MVKKNLKKFKTDKSEDSFKFIKIAPAVICSRAEVCFEVKEDTVFVDDLPKIADYFGFKLLPQVEKFFFGGWWWAKNE